MSRDDPMFNPPSNHHFMPDHPAYGRYLWVRDRVPKGSRVLDVGCNCGQLCANLIDEIGCECVGVDIEPRFIEHCRKRKPGTYHLADFTAMDVSKLGTFDVVTALEIIEHPMDIRGFFENVTAVLKTGGRFIVTTPYAFGRHGYKYFFTHAHHVRVWTEVRLRVFYEHYGLRFAEKEILYYGERPNWIGVLAYKEE